MLPPRSRRAGALALLALACCRAPEPQAAAPSATARITAWLDERAVVVADGAVWPVQSGAPLPRVETRLHDGVAGVVAFYLEHFRATGRQRSLELATLGGSALLARTTPRLTACSPGLYSGIAGYGHVFLALHEATGDARFGVAAGACCDELARRARAAGAGVEWCDAIDLDSGTAGIGLFLLEMERRYRRGDALDLAVRGAARLIQLGLRHEAGLGWPRVVGGPDDLASVHSGTASAVVFLAALYERTGHRPHLDAAIRGAEFLAASIAPAAMAQARSRRNQLDWCDAPGEAARAFLRLYRTTGNERWLRWVRAADRYVQSASLVPAELLEAGGEHGACCGPLGLLAFSGRLHVLDGDERRAQVARGLLDGLVERAIGGRPRGTARPTGLARGAAGLGMLALALELRVPCSLPDAALPPPSLDRVLADNPR